MAVGPVSNENSPDTYTGNVMVLGAPITESARIARRELDRSPHESALLSPQRHDLGTELFECWATDRLALWPSDPASRPVETATLWAHPQNRADDTVRRGGRDRSGRELPYRNQVPS